MSDVRKNENEKMKDRRVVKCRGCKSPTNEHHWGILSKFCEGFEKSSPMKGDMVVRQETSTETLDSLKADLQALDIEEQAFRRKSEEAKLREKIEAKRHPIHDLNARTCKLGESSRTLKSKDLPHLPHEEEPFRTPLDDLLMQSAPNLGEHPLSTAWFPQHNSFQHSSYQSPPPSQEFDANASASEMFFKPRKIAKGNKPSLIVDFVTNIIPQDEEETLSNQGQAKIVVSYGPKKPKLETVTVQQWVIANTRIFYSLLAEGKLAGQKAIQDYLIYTVKEMELSSKYDWKSLLLYDGEFRKLQAIYALLWGFDSTHLHAVMLQPKIDANVSPKPVFSCNPNSRAMFANFTLDGRITCWNFNGQRDVRYLIAILLTSTIAKLPGKVEVCHILGYPINPMIRKARNDYRFVQTF